MKKERVIAFFYLFLSLILVSGEGTCNKNEEGDHNDSLAFKYKMVALLSILVASVIGVCLPIVGKKIPALGLESDLFFIFKAFAAGVILATGFVHVFPDAFENLTNPCLKGKAWDFPFTGFIAMLAAIGTLLVNSLASWYYIRSHYAELIKGGEEVAFEHGDHVQLHTQATHGHATHAHGSDLSISTLIQHRIISQVLELGIVVHSVIIGISLGVSEKPSTIRPMIGALIFHQFFEGMGLGGCISQAKFKSRAVKIMAIFFSLTTPFGIALGMGITNVYRQNSTTALIVEGIFNSASAGILIYMALVDLLATDFMSPRMQSSGKLQFGVNISLLAGAGSMSFLGTWA